MPSRNFGCDLLIMHLVLSICLWYRLEQDSELARNIAEAGTLRMSQMTIDEVTRCESSTHFSQSSSGDIAISVL